MSLAAHHAAMHGKPVACDCFGDYGCVVQKFRGPLRVLWEEDAMISLEDCIALCGLTEEEVRALAEHEQIDEMRATALAQCLLGQPDGCRKIGAMIADDVNWAILRGDRGHADELLITLERFVISHTEALGSKRAQACLVGRGGCGA
jgi:hypothetical protein